MMRKGGDLFRDERGFTTVSMVLSLLITLALVFTAAQVYRINSACAEVQDVADAAALAAENQVSKYMLVARFCDAVVLALTLTGLAAMGLGLAALCTPYTASASGPLLNAGKHLIKERDAFAERAANVLNKLQEALPFFAAAAAAGVSAANDSNVSGSRHIGVAVLVPVKGETISVDPEGAASDLVDDIDREADEIREKAKRAEEASEEANRSKERAFQRDCGDNPSYCMYERAGHLAGLGGSSNPLYTFIEAWSFSVALARAKAYYRQRLNIEGPADSSYEEQARSALRTRFYRYAVSELGTGYVHETNDSFDAYFPHLPSNTAEMRLTSLYTDAVYPVTTSESGSSIMHAWPGCPEAASSLSYGSIAQMESGDFETCPVCGFTAASLGRVAAASTSVENGFEYHYEAVADEAAIYESKRHEADEPKSQVKSKVGELLKKLAEVAKDTVNKRIVPEPPGRYGAVAFVINVGNTSVPGGFASSFVSVTNALGPRAAVSAATLVDEGSEEGKTAINSMLDGIRGDGVASGVAGMILDAWSWALSSYAEGQEALVGGIQKGLDALPLASASGLGTWAAGKLTDAIEGVGLQPAEVGALKPLLVNSAHVVAKDDGAFGQRLLSVKKHLIAHPLMSTDLFSSLLSDAESTALGQVENMGTSITIASIELVGSGGLSIPITVPIPQEVRDWASGTISDLFARLRSYYVETTGVRVWE